MRVTRGDAHANRRTRTTMIIMTRGSAEVCKRAKGKGQSKSHQLISLLINFLKSIKIEK